MGDTCSFACGTYSCNDLTLFVSRIKIKLKSWVIFHAPSVSREDGKEGGWGFPEVALKPS